MSAYRELNTISRRAGIVEPTGAENERYLLTSGDIEYGFTNLFNCADVRCCRSINMFIAGTEAEWFV